MNPAESGETELFVQHIACINNAGFAMWFEIDRVSGGGQAGRTRRYPINQTRKVDLATLRFNDEPLQVGDEVRPRVRAIAGQLRTGPSVRYAPNGHTATYTVRGTTLNFSVRRI